MLLNDKLEGEKLFLVFGELGDLVIHFVIVIVDSLHIVFADVRNFI